VWGPKPIALGFIGAPLATAISFNLIAISSIAYGIFFVPRTAWHPFSRLIFTDLGVLVRLGLAGVGPSCSTCHRPLFDNMWSLAGQTASEWWSWELMGRECLSLDDWNGLADKVMPSRCQPVSTDRFRVHSCSRPSSIQSRAYRPSGTICVIGVRINNVSGTVGLECVLCCQVANRGW
jgi:hypothetical protein